MCTVKNTWERKKALVDVTRTCFVRVKCSPKVILILNLAGQQGTSILICSSPFGPMEQSKFVSAFAEKFLKLSTITFNILSTWTHVKIASQINFRESIGFHG